jgi:glycine betaine/proline transport system permease protein
LIGGENMFPEALSFTVAPYIDIFVDWLKAAGGPLFSAFSDTVLAFLLKIEAFLLVTPWWIWIAVVIFISWWQTRRWWNSLGLGLLLITIGVLGLWDVTMKTLAIVIVSVLISILLGIPLGMTMAESNRFNAAVTPLLDAMQTMPSFVYLIPAMMLFHLGKVPAIVATVIYALPPVVRLTNLGIRQVASTIQESAIAFGATRWQLIKEVRLPLAVPSIMAGINQTTMMALSMVVICSMIGAGGLGQKVLVATNHIAVGDGFEAGWAIVALAIVIDRLTQGLIKKWEIPQA